MRIPLKWLIVQLAILPLVLTACSDTKGNDNDSPTDAGLDTGEQDSDDQDNSDDSNDSDENETDDEEVLTGTERLFDDNAPIWHFDIEVEKDDWAWLNANQTKEQYVPAAVVFEDQSYDRAAIRYKGGYGTLLSCVNEEGDMLCPKLSIKLSFNEGENNEKGRFLGVRKLLFHACTRDSTCLRDRLSYGLFREMGIEACRVGHATLTINGENYGLYILIEYIDKEFLEDHFADPEGNLYKERWPLWDLDIFYIEGMRTNESAADVSHMLEFAEALAKTDDQNFARDISPFIDMDLMARYNAVDQVINNWDGIWKFYCEEEMCGNHNFYMYDDPSSGRFIVIPWDHDNTFNEPNQDMARSWWDDGPTACDIDLFTLPGLEGERGIRAPQCDPLMRGLMRSSDKNYKKALQEVLHGEQTGKEAMLARLDRYRALIRPAIETDPHLLAVDEWDAKVTVLRQIIIAQYKEVERLLEE
ncbi:MAG: hypothetical protein GY847_14805 [Proteobacteria bacterium]|nr:hypothetical protein [Pseudomonadota bacterium]